MKVGDRAPNLSYTRPDGTTGTIQELTGRSVILIFMRHLM